MEEETKIVIGKDTKMWNIGMFALFIVITIIAIQQQYRYQKLNQKYEDYKLQAENGKLLYSNTVVSIVRTNISIQYVTNYLPVYVGQTNNSIPNSIMVIDPTINLYKTDPWLYIDPNTVESKDVQKSLETVLDISVKEARKGIQDKIKLIESLRSLK